ncbi:MAG: O-antigen ligase family protein [Bacteroidales bacterium]|nr:O-antigen ligase family protein [Bacteroidales bacterium]
MKHFFTSLIAPLRWYEKVEYCLMALMAVALPIHWRLGLWGLVLLLVFTLVKSVTTHRIGNPSLTHPIRICLYLMMLYYLVHVCSVAYSSDSQEGWAIVGLKLPLLLLPLYFLLSDTSYLRRQHVSAFSYLLAGTLTVRFVIMAIRAIIGYLNGTPISLLVDFHFDPLHHNYMALYLLTAIALLYVELVRHTDDAHWRVGRWLLAADMVVLMMYLVILGSRSGLVVLALLAVACLAHLAFVRKRWMLTGLTVAALVVMIGGSYLAMPTLYWRIIYSVEKIAAGEQGDGRQVMWQCGAEALKGHELIGYGCGGYWDVLHERYVAHDFAEGYTHEKYSTHNQYLETALSTGIIGLVLLLAMVIMPMVLALHKPRRNLPMMLFSIVYGLCIAFEATFGRQMGLLFVSWWYCALLLNPAPLEHQELTTSQG